MSVTHISDNNYMVYWKKKKKHPGENNTGDNKEDFSLGDVKELNVMSYTSAHNPSLKNDHILDIIWLIWFKKSLAPPSPNVVLLE